MKIKRFVSGSLESNGYVLYQKDGRSCLLIDPGYQPKTFIQYIQEQNLQLTAIILTHLHHDHTGAAEAVQRVFECPIYMHKDDAYVYGGQVDVMMEDGFSFDLEGETLQVMHTPGHTMGSVCIYSEKSKVCFTGDTIFDTDLGRTDLAGGSESMMADSIRNVVDRWDNQVTIYPGHDGSCNMKFVRTHNQEFLALRDGHDR